MIGMVLQDTWLFGGTIADNIAYGLPGATREQIIEAAKATYVDRFVRTLPDGYDTVLDDEGAERQRGGEAADHDRPGVPGPAGDPDPGRGDQLGRHPHRGADPAGDELAAPRPDQLRDRAPAVHDPGRRPDPGHGVRADRRAGHARRAARPRTAPTPGCTRPSSPRRWRPRTRPARAGLGQADLGMTGKLRGTAGIWAAGHSSCPSLACPASGPKTGERKCPSPNPRT